ncbi:Iron-sulfur flavoprotein [Candidatus Syntrophocurvum alkaliphilum]|uniref:Iron-sulfur flavoprotein n=1 Tax=Candidatus Syntrophocurvum alkaliphilum TaxID=2293317 RepID=A0A6I6DL93_9FIRM|nr:flavodoxin family protein [Candidatus Syntrophocurvum alkaliphilum]QGT99971.1 Iron-sulfur flavoprotein [Candidatus Syntrophocurvum alkaliphilum]
MSDLLIVGVNGSPNSSDNTAFLLDQALNETKKYGAITKVIHCSSELKKINNPFCHACSSPCTAKCIEDNEIFDAYKLMALADGIIVGSPVYFGTVSAQLKAFFDKTRWLRTEKSLMNTIGGALSVGNSRFGGQETTLKAIHDILLVQGMIVVGDGHYDNDCGHSGAAAQRPAKLDENGINRSRILGKRIAEVAKHTKDLRKR